MAGKPAFRSPCPIARSLDAVGEWWSMLILRDAFHGLTRFDEFEKSLGIAPTMLTRRLAELVDAGLFERRAYSDKPLRYEYVLTPRGEDFWPVLVALIDWGNRHFAPEGQQVVVANRATGKAVEPRVVEAKTGRAITAKDHMMGAGPIANEFVRRRIAFAQARFRDSTLRPTYLAAEVSARAAARKRRSSATTARRQS